MLASSFFHELGHASACKYFGVRHGGVGFGLYLTFPVLYTDVTEIWKLNRRQRCVVNLAGVYFQSYGLILLLVAFFVTGDDILRYLILIMNLGFLMTLNPFFKFDGYWIASDLLGVPNVAATFHRAVGLPLSANPEMADYSKALFVAHTSVGAIWAAALCHRGQCLYGLLLFLCHSPLPVSVCRDLPRGGSRVDPLPLQWDDTPVRPVAEHRLATPLPGVDRLYALENRSTFAQTLCPFVNPLPCAGDIRGWRSCLFS